MLYREWEVCQPDAQQSRALGEAVGAGRLLSDVLLARGFDTPEKAAAVLATEESLSSPYLLKDMDKAVQRIHRAIAQGEPMVVFGDYDVDGITATALLYSCLESLGADVYYKLSSRTDDGYGLSAALVDSIADRGMALIITVDNGTSSVEAAVRAKERGVDLIITDHHLAPDPLPDALAVVNPCRPDNETPFGNFSGVGVAFLLAAALEDCEPAELVQEFGDLAAIGTVADVMRLTGENRILVKAGLAALQDTARPGLGVLIEACGWKGRAITAENISYGLAPRLNAAGRMDDATDALRLLLADSEEEALPLVEGLQEQNAARQKAEQEITAAIVAEIDANPELQRARVIVVWGEGWHQGVIGIVSSRLQDKYAKPAIVISFDGEEGRGSGRSLRGFSLYSAIASCEDLLVRFGGHDLAAGFSIRRANAGAFREKINAWADEHCPALALPALRADAVVSMADLGVEAVRELDRLAPCGSGNPEPKFLLEGAVVDGLYPLSEGRHTRVRLRQRGGVLHAVLFGTAPGHLAYRQGSEVDVLLALSVYEGRAGEMVSARVVEMRPAGLGNEHVSQSALFKSFVSGCEPLPAQKDLLRPTREDTALVYRAVREGGMLSGADLRPAFARFGEAVTGRVLTSLAALEELGLVRRNEATAGYEIVPVQGKKDLAASTLLRRLEV